MSTKGEAYAGLSVAITTPFKNDEVDYALLREQIEFQVAAGTKCLVPVGTTGESPTLSHDEHERVVAEVVQAAKGRIKVMAGTGSNSTREALRLSKRAEKDGADALLIVAPYYNKPTQEGFYQHYKAIMSFGTMLPTTEITPRPPTDISGSVKLSSPERIVRFVAAAMCEA